MGICVVVLSFSSLLFTWYPLVFNNFKALTNSLHSTLKPHPYKLKAFEMELNMDEKMVGAEVEPWFKPKKGGLIPPKRKLVKRMMFELMVKSIATLLCRHHHPSSSSEVEMTSTPLKKSSLKNMKIFPNEGHQLSAPLYPDDHS